MIDQKLASVGRSETEQMLVKRALASTCTSNNRHSIACFDRYVDIAECGLEVRLIAHLDIFKLNSASEYGVKRQGFTGALLL